MPSVPIFPSMAIGCATERHRLPPAVRRPPSAGEVRSPEPIHLPLIPELFLPLPSGSTSHNPFDIFEQFFGGGGSSRGRRQRQGEDVVHSLKISLEDLYNGTTKELSLSRNVLCEVQGKRAQRVGHLEDVMDVKVKE